MRVKNFLIGAVVGFNLAMGLSFLLVGSNNSEYALTTKVAEINNETDTVICIDSNGNKWAFEGVEDWMIGDYCSMIMNDNSTEIIYDDIIVSTRYSGRFE